MVVKKSLRKYAPINLFPRLASDEDTLPSGHKVAGDFILFYLPTQWEKPESVGESVEFNRTVYPNERQLQVQSGKAGQGIREGRSRKVEIAKERMRRALAAGRDFTYTPFGAGPRSCIGGVFAFLLAMTTMLAAVQNFKFGRCDSGVHEDRGKKSHSSLRYDYLFPRGRVALDDATRPSWEAIFNSLPRGENLSAVPMSR